MTAFPHFAAFAGCTFQGKTLEMSSFVCQDILPRGIFHPEKGRTNDWCKRIKAEDRSDYNPLSATSITNGNLHSKSYFPHYNFQKAVPLFYDNEATTGTESIFSVTSARYRHDIRGHNSGSIPLFQDMSLGNEDFTVFDTASTIQGLSVISESGCALSLLSSKSQNSSSPLSRIPVAPPLVIKGGGTHYNMSEVAEKLIGVSSQANKFSLPGNNSVEGSNLGSILVSDSSDVANFDVSKGFYRGSDFMNSKDRHSCEDGATIDLLPQSSQLQRVEHQRQSMQVKDENDTFCCLRIT